MYYHHDLENEIQNPLASASRFLKARTKGNLEVKPVTVTNLSTFQPFNHSTNYPSHLTLHASRKSAFTLAEVLITLGIIGVVAALVIPNLISNYEKKVIETGIAKTYSELSTWLQKAENDYGPFTDWDFSSVNIVDTYIKPYMTFDACSNSSKCFEKYNTTNYVGWYRPTATATRGDFETAEIALTRYISPDGRAFFIRKEFYPTWDTPGKGIIFVVDVNGKRGRTVMGQDVFMFSINNFRNGTKGKLVAGSTVGYVTEDWAKRNCILSSVAYSGQHCSILLERNNWKFPKDYPIKF